MCIFQNFSESSSCFQALTFLFLSQDLSIWAYPMVPNHYEDAIVCCIRENPEPVVFKVCCDAFRPELDLDRKQLHFDRVLLHRLV